MRKHERELLDQIDDLREQIKQAEAHGDYKRANNLEWKLLAREDRLKGKNNNATIGDNIVITK